MTPTEIKRQIKEKGGTQAKVARRLRVSQTALNFFIHRKLKSARIQRGLAKYLGLENPDELNGVRQ
jgi:hypothetical protein